MYMSLKNINHIFNFLKQVLRFASLFLTKFNNPLEKTGLYHERRSPSLRKQKKTLKVQMLYLIP